MKRFTPIGAAIAAVLLGACAWTALGGGAKYTKVHGVNWHQSFDEAKAVAKKSGKPILLLSMFGRLDEEMPCANARTLRATLFKDPEFVKMAETEFVPVWEMVRAVPKVYLDLGDGKQVVRTVRGNAVMYLCNPDGKVIDVYPGVYVKGDFMPMIRASIAKLASADEAAVVRFHDEQATTRRLAMTRITTGKMAVESPTLELMGAPPLGNPVSPQWQNGSDPKRYQFLVAASRLVDASLTPRNIRLVEAELLGPNGQKLTPEQRADRIMRADSATNMRTTRAVVHLWLASQSKLPTPSEAREDVLERMLKIPYKDPYFGLKDVLLPGTP